MLKILITGANGYVGSNLTNFLQNAGYDVYGLDLVKAQNDKIFQLDLADSEKIFKLIESLNPDVIIHTAALSSLKVCEKNLEQSIKANVSTTRNLIKAIQGINKNIKLVFLSSDYVFDGKHGNYSENDLVDPQTVYGKTKALSETEIKESIENFIILRTANVYGRGGNFFSFVLGELQQNKSVEVFDDTFFTPTYITYLLDSLKKLIELDFKGVIHVAGSERLSRYDFALRLAETLNKDTALVRPVKVLDQLIAKDSSLNCEYSRKILHNCWPTVRESLSYTLGNIIQPYFCHIDQRGKIIGVFQGLDWKEINYVESAKGSSRGNHYHEDTVEGFFLIDGKVRVTLYDASTNSKLFYIAEKGSILIIQPMTIHTFEIIEDSKWINMLSKPLGNVVKDIHPLKS